MPDAAFDYLDAISEHSAGLAAAAEGNLDALVVHCPGWDVADLVWHVTEVHWFWATIADERLSSPPDESRRPQRPERDGLIEAFRSGADHLIQVLERTPDDAKVWTWAPGQQDVEFIARHQVQEAAVHHWDVVNAVGGQLEIAAPIATDAIDEFLTFSVSSDVDPADPPRPALDGKLALVSSDVDAAWTIEDGGRPGTVRMTRGALAATPAVTGTASDLLLWLYRRVELPIPADAQALADRFRALTFTD